MQNSDDKQMAGKVENTPPPAVYYVQQPPQDYADDEINLLDYWRVLVAYKWLIVAVTFLASSAAIAAALLMTEIYRAEVIVTPAEEGKGGGLAALAGQFGGLASLAGVNLGGGGGKSEQALATLNSRSFTVSFIKENDLMPVLFEDKWDATAKKWNTTDPKETPSEWDAYKMFNEGIRSVSNDAKTGMITVAIEWKDPELAAQWANALVERLNKHQKEAAINEAEKSIAYLQQQLAQTSIVEMHQAIYQLVEAQTKNIMLANVRDEYAFKVIDPAVVPERRIKPKRSLMAVLGFMVGMMLGVFLAFFLSFIKNQKQAAEAS